MNQTELLRCERSTTARNPQIHDIDATNEGPNRHTRQFIATIWIIAAWLLGTLVSELNVIGGEPERKISIAQRSWAPDSMLQQCREWETEFAMVHGGMVAFDRLNQVTESSGTAVAEVAPQSTPTTTNVEYVAPQTRDRIRTVANDEIRSTDGDTQVDLAFNDASDDRNGLQQQALTKLAWQEFPEGSTPGLVQLAVHGFQELMTPVHVRNHVTSEAAIPPPDRASQSEGSVVFVEADMQESVSATDPPAVAVADVDQQDQDEVDTDARGTIPSAGTPQIVRSRSKLLRVREPTALALPRMTESSGNSEHATFAIAPPAVRARVEPGVVQRRPDKNLRLGTGPVSNVQAGMGSVNNVLVGTGPIQKVQVETGSARNVLGPAGPAPNAQGRKEPDEHFLPEPRLAAKWPFDGLEQLSSTEVTLNVDQVDVRSVFEMLARGYKINILVAPGVVGTVTANVDHLTPQQTLQGIVKMCNLNMQQEGDLIYIYPADELPSDSRQLRVFSLDFARAATLEPAVQGLLSPVGNAYPSTISEEDNLQTQESIVVVDIPSVIAQVEDYILQADRAPRQVMIEAKILEVTLSDEMEHGINFGALLSGDLAVGTVGFVLPDGDTPSSSTFFGVIDGTRVGAVLDLLETTTDYKTLASPRVQVLNGQNARIQVGQQLGFRVVTVTQTSTIEDVQFLETGVVLSVTPTISRDNRILMEVKPQVSDGIISEQTNLPEEITRELETSVLLDNHQGMIIGGLIQEKDETVIKKLPWLGDVRYIGKFFQHRLAIRSRTEIIVALIPHIVEPSVRDERSMIEYERIDTPLLHGVLQRTCRPWEPRLPDRAGEHNHMDVNRLNRMLP